jgi:hypothetical protein
MDRKWRVQTTRLVLPISCKADIKLAWYTAALRQLYKHELPFGHAAWTFSRPRHSSSVVAVKPALWGGNLRSRLGLAVAFLLGVGVAVVTLQVLPLLSLQLANPENLSVVVPAVTTESYRYRGERGFEAVLVSENGRRLEFPLMWLPGEIGSSSGYRVDTKIEPGETTTSFRVVIQRLE